MFSLTASIYFDMEIAAGCSLTEVSFEFHRIHFTSAAVTSLGAVFESRTFACVYEAKRSDATRIAFTTVLLSVE